METLLLVLLAFLEVLEEFLLVDDEDLLVGVVFTVLLLLVENEVGFVLLVLLLIDDEVGFIVLVLLLDVIEEFLEFTTPLLNVLL